MQTYLSKRTNRLDLDLTKILRTFVVSNEPIPCNLLRQNAALRIIYSLYQDSHLMSDQPIIIEDNPTTNPKQLHHENTDIFFYELLDQVEEYDSLASKIRKLHQEATLNLASVKFVDPFSLFPSAHRCLPAFLTIREDGQLQHGYVPFTQQIDEDLYFEEFDEQVEIEKECLSKQALQIQQGQKSKEKERKFIEKELLYRFNVLNQQDKIIATAQKFTLLLGQLLELANKKKEVATQFSKFEQKGAQ